LPFSNIGVITKKMSNKNTTSTSGVVLMIKSYLFGRLNFNLLTISSVFHSYKLM